MFYTIISMCFYFGRRRYYYQLLRNSWRLDMKKLELFDISKAPPTKSTNSFSSVLGSRNNDNVKADGPSSKTFLTVEQLTASAEDSFRVTGRYNGTLVCVKLQRKARSFGLRYEDWVRLDAIKRIQHDNLNQFFGAKLDMDLELAVFVWQQQARGTLEDILLNSDIQLDMMFKTSIMRDVIKGMEYLHKHRITIGVHGCLSTDNCLVDSRWVVKLTDFGLADIMFAVEQSKTTRLVEYRTYEPTHASFSMAPEQLRDLDDGQFSSTQTADIYSLGMVLYQILTKKSLFEDENLTPAEVILRIKQPNHLNPFRPAVPPSIIGREDPLFDVVRQCWQEMPIDRPSITHVRNAVNRLTKAYSKNLVDHMVIMLEKYAANLEKIVAERTKELEKEEQQTDTLLSQLLPRQVVDSLKAGRAVPAETFESVTVYFSDIVGFTNICSSSHPMEVVNMLNQLYTSTDAIIAKFDAYKVETIGDAYLVVSGLPTRNGEHHATEIAQMALQIRQLVHTFSIAHQPGRHMQIRIGLHTGPVAAGVVGLTMPRYCIFGDTVNVGSKMESSGVAMKIQVSQVTRDLLQHCSSYSLQPRGLVELKGKGLYQTYWLEKTRSSSASLDVVEAL